MGIPRAQELLVILVIMLLLFGARKLPELGRSVGRSIRELRGGLKEDEMEVESAELADGES